MDKAVNIKTYDGHADPSEFKRNFEFIEFCFTVGMKIRRS